MIDDVYFGMLSTFFQRFLGRKAVFTIDIYLFIFLLPTHFLAYYIAKD